MDWITLGLEILKIWLAIGVWELWRWGLRLWKGRRQAYKSVPFAEPESTSGADRGLGGVVDE